MKKYLVSCLVVIGIIVGIGFGIYSITTKSTILGTQTSQKIYRPTEQIVLNPNQITQTPITVMATKLPEFTVDLTEQKFRSLLNISQQKLTEIVQATIVHQAYANEKVVAEINVDQQKSKLIVRPQDIPDFKPGMYKLHLTLRTLEGEVNIDQDFTWGVIAINTNKSIYKPGDVATIGLGVLNDKGETQCKTGNSHANVWLTVTDPTGVTKEYSTSDNTIHDSGKCSPNSITNDPDFVAIYLIGQPGIYKMKVRAQIGDTSREIEDYFKVEQSPAFDVERSSFPTRIYPKALYTVQFKVTPQDDYSGTVEDVTPANFKISNVSNNGKNETLGEFQKITWHVNLKKGQSQTFTYAINFPLVSPEFYLLGPIKIGNFQEARQWQVASDAMNTTSGLVAYEDNASQNTWSRTWSGTAYSTEGQMATGANTPTDSRWFREVSSPKTGEKLIAVLDNDTADVVYVYRWSGTAWLTADLRIVMTGNTTAETTRKIDIAYEQQSGDAIFAYADSASGVGTENTPNQVLYRKYTSATHTWDSSSLVAGTATSPKNWIRLKPQRSSDNILLTTLNTSNFVGAMIWNGTTNAWENEMPDDGTGETATATNTQEPVDAAWETQSGAAMVIYGTTGNNIVYRRFTSSWGSETTALSGFTNDVAWLVADSNLNSSSNEIAVGTVELTAQVCRFIIWDGSTWTQGSTVSCRANIVQREIGVVWEYADDKAMWVYVTSAAGTQLSYRTYTGGVFGADTLITGSPNGTNNILAVQAYSDSLSLGTVILTSVANGATNAFLYSREWDGAAWGSFSRVDTHASGIQGVAESAEAYGFGFDRNLETLAAYRWYNNNSTSIGALGAGDLVSLAATNSAYTLTSASQQFRLRFLLYYPDSLLTSAGRAYKLQYVDPGSGTCADPTGGTPSIYTDVGTAGSTLISYYDNPTAPTMNDKVPIATNSAEPSYLGLTVDYQNYIESNNFTNGRTNMVANHLGIWDASLVDNTVYDRIAQTFCFRVARSSDLVLQIGTYPQITTASIPDVLIKSGTLIQSGTRLQ